MKHNVRETIRNPVPLRRNTKAAMTWITENLNRQFQWGMFFESLCKMIFNCELLSFQQDSIEEIRQFSVALSWEVRCKMKIETCESDIVQGLLCPYYTHPPLLTSPFIPRSSDVPECPGEAVGVSRQEDTLTSVLETKPMKNENTVISCCTPQISTCNNTVFVA